VSKQKSVDRSQQSEVGQLELPLASLPVQVPERTGAATNVLAFAPKPPKPSKPNNTSTEALSRILAYAETLAP
jgi:hypothetical protein